MSSETSFLRLSRKTQKKVDSAFDFVAEKHFKNASNPSTTVAGGFIPEQGGFVRECDDEGDQPAGGFISEPGGHLHNLGDFSTSGGFFPDDDEQSTSSGSTHIPLSLIPVALQYLNLEPNDEEVLAVFRNAATGWTSSNSITGAQKASAENQFVSKEDWRSVCAVLLEDDSENNHPDQDMEMIDPGDLSDGAEDSDDYRESEADEEEADLDDDDGDYLDPPHTSATRRRTRKSARKSSLSPSPSDLQPRKLTQQQRQACIDAYSLFFPTISSEELLSQKIMIKDIQRAAKLLNEKIKTDEMVAMLETFSTSPDKSMNFDDFCRMMVRAGLAA